ncbi:hypothetical protein LMG28140_04217 [Paraburkholderia metrosideri]|jgi:hypothetical protein|uniref:Uncharacterized protein n=1 Tax=Paraburkholderia metrosideri TaxID=580937 RepID=A0ABN7HZ89_9BURK|nr:hypothetical protein LMG28140_04217 [Paraburkholderia metrosideri]
MTFEEWAVDNFDPTQSAYMAAKAAWEARGKLPQERPAQQPESIRSACHVRPDRPPPLSLPDDLERDKS